MSDEGGPDVGLEVVEPAPDATCETVAALEAGDAGLDPGAESGYRDPSHPDNARGSVARQITRAMGLSGPIRATSSHGCDH